MSGIPPQYMYALIFGGVWHQCQVHDDSDDTDDEDNNDYTDEMDHKDETDDDDSGNWMRCRRWW